MMQKTLLAIAIPAALLSNSVSAVELYKSDTNTFAVGGHVSGGITGSDEGETEVNSISPRLNISATHDVGNGFTADAKAEWGLNFMTGGDTSLTTRLGYLGLTHEEYGRGVIGTQWSPYYDVAGVTDMPIYFANEFLYADHYSMGTARAEKMLSYRNGLDFGDAGVLNFGLGWQGAAGDNDDRVQASLSYSILGASLGYAYGTGSTVATGTSEDAVTQAVSLSYGSYGDGLYLAGVFAKNDFVADPSFNSLGILNKTYNYEAIAAYALDNSLNISLNFEQVKDEEQNNGTLTSQSALQIEYNFSSSTMGYVGYQVDLGDDVSEDDNIWAIGARFFL